MKVRSNTTHMLVSTEGQTSIVPIDLIRDVVVEGKLFGRAKVKILSKDGNTLSTIMVHRGRAERLANKIRKNLRERSKR